MKFDNFCDFFAQIEADPSAIIKDFTVRDYLNARMHIQGCEQCKERQDRVLAKSPKNSKIEFNQN